MCIRDSIWSDRGFAGHDWLFCMLHNFGGNIGLYGRIPTLCGDLAEAEAKSTALKGIGLAPEGIETNPVVYELMTELPWHDGPVDADKWIKDYASARYGKSTPAVDKAWQLLKNSVYNCPRGNTQQGTAESVFCARPSDNPRMASAWAQLSPYYDFDDVRTAAKLLAAEAPAFDGNTNYEYDLVDVVRQVVADKGREVAADFKAAAEAGNREAYARHSRRFMQLIDMQDRLLATIPDFRLGTWIEKARNRGNDKAEQDLFEWNARVQITCWGGRVAADKGKLHDYAHREWQGLLSDFYAPRWQKWFETRLANWDKPDAAKIDFYRIEEPWTMKKNHYSSSPEGKPAEIAADILTSALAI